MLRVSTFGTPWRGIPSIPLDDRIDVSHCEGWDIFSLRHGLHRRYDDGSEDEDGGEAESERESRIDEERQGSLELIEHYLRDGDVTMAHRIYQEAVDESGSWELPEPMLRDFVKLYQKAGAWDEAKPMLLEYVRRFPGKSALMKLLLAHVYIETEGRPARGLSILETVDADRLAEPHRKVREKLVRTAEKMRADGLLELDLGD